jgi:F-type H+-transporting ATPase subunit delta
MTTTSREYAEALFELSAEEGLTEETDAGLETVISAMRQTPEYKALLASAAVSKENRLNALEEAFRGKVTDVLMAVLRMMVAKGHVREIENVARDYGELARQYTGEVLANVTSAVPLKEAEAVAIRLELEKRLGRPVTLNCRLDPSLIGGVRVEADGRVIDGSIRNKLEQIKEVMDA